MERGKRDQSPCTPWADVVLLMIEYKLAGMPQKDKFSSLEADKAIMVVGYVPDTLSKFKLPKDWVCKKPKQKE